MGDDRTFAGWLLAHTQGHAPDPACPACPTAGRVSPTDDTLRDRIWKTVADIRDASPRLSTDADTDEIVDAVLAMPEVRDALADPDEAAVRRAAERLGRVPELDNHHNADVCPYCNAGRQRDALAAQQRVTAALALHTSVQREGPIGGMYRPTCRVCLHTYPCRTVRALTGDTEPPEDARVTAALALADEWERLRNRADMPAAGAAELRACAADLRRALTGNTETRIYDGPIGSSITCDCPPGPQHQPRCALRPRDTPPTEPRWHRALNGDCLHYGPVDGCAACTITPPTEPPLVCPRSRKFPPHHPAHDGYCLDTPPTEPGRRGQPCVDVDGLVDCDGSHDGPCAGDESLPVHAWLHGRCTCGVLIPDRAAWVLHLNDTDPS